MADNNNMAMMALVAIVAVVGVVSMVVLMNGGSTKEVAVPNTISEENSAGNAYVGTGYCNCGKSSVPSSPTENCVQTCVRTGHLRYIE